ncbi:Small, acid-soluble spore protein, alpha/beta type [Paenibacillus sp. yr247]|uniref:alpha/beta-type small acid-soluble spore protein n=1 Tax=Paenibacillus sp. yr247 TaxID=1761880 RepID=UPI000884C5D3|nr:alpha/beta-type small acid-soluble spore protein [Paenibacillus sp. yr247]SDP10262.1 Small, acid-soluble spore protein, alpha/beta type [Paenibacillus sp. yr247]
MASRNTLVVQQAKAGIDQLKFEVAQELGIALSPTGYNGNLATRDAGFIGGNITKRLVQIAEQQLSGSAAGIRR